MKKSLDKNTIVKLFIDACESDSMEKIEFILKVFNNMLDIKDINTGINAASKEQNKSNNSDDQYICIKHLRNYISNKDK